MCVCFCVCVFFYGVSSPLSRFKSSIQSDLLCVMSSLSAPIQLCSPNHSSMTNCLLGKQKPVCESVCVGEKNGDGRVCVCVCVWYASMHVSVCILGFLHIASDPEWSPDCILITGTLHSVTEKTTHTHTTRTHREGWWGQGYRNVELYHYS